MRFTEVFGIQRNDEDDWFDPVLSADTRLFVDPFLIFADDDPPWQQGHASLIEFFQGVLELVAKAPNERSASWQAAARLMVFPEPAEFCLGVGVKPLGRGTGEVHRDGMLAAARVAVRQASAAPLTHFEELSLFEDGIGADLVSDIVCNVLKSHFIAYTREVLTRHGVEDLHSIPVPHASWDLRYGVWRQATVDLPLNPFTQRAVLLTPTRFMRKIPTVDPEAFWDWSWENQNKEIRGAFNYAIGKDVNGPKIAEFARANPHLAREYIKAIERRGKPRPYDFERDPDGEVTWYDAGETIAGYADIPKEIPDDPNEFCAYVESLLRAFAEYIETNRDGWENLWVDDQPRKERHVQAALRTFLFLICRDRDIDLSAEPNTGRGPVDFKFSVGFRRRALAEVKLMESSSYFDNLENQTPAYMRADGASCGYFLSVGFRDSDFAAAKKKSIIEGAEELEKKFGITFKVIFVDARKKPSASKLKSPRPRAARKKKRDP